MTIRHGRASSTYQGDEAQSLIEWLNENWKVVPEAARPTATLILKPFADAEEDGVFGVMLGFEWTDPVSNPGERAKS